jgi:hypothetical protein
MKIQQFNPKIISITQLRRDIDILNKVLEREKEALVMRNQNLLFVAITPEKYQKLQGEKENSQTIKAAVATIERIRSHFSGAKKTTSVSEYVSRMRDERVKKWKK